MDVDPPEDAAPLEEEGEAEMALASTRCLFEESEELKGLIAGVVQASHSSTNEARFDRARTILDKYQEMPQLLNPHLEGLLAPLVNAISAAVASPEGHGLDLLTVSRLIYVISKVRGYKSVVSYFPHEVRFLEPVFHFYLQQKRDSDVWELRYSLLLWLSNVVLIPFHLATVDSNVLSEGLVGSMVDVCQAALGETGIVREGAAFLLARLLTRPDTHQPLHNFLAWTTPIVDGASAGGTQMFLQVGVLLALAHILKSGQRQELLPHMDTMAAIVLQQTGSTSTTLRSKLLLKVAQRIATTYLPVRRTTWRYTRGTQSLLDNLARTHGNGVGAGQPMDCDKDTAELEEDIALPEQVEEIVGLLLDGLRHRDTVVRWSAAKGLGRISQRLPKDNANDILQAVLGSCFDLYEADAGWHGGCLCLAELARRGVLLPGALEKVVPVVLRALTYSLLKTSHAVGAHVRDAACYVCWAFARAYRPEDLHQCVVNVAQQLVVTAVFDREVNVRRAAAAAFQECVGRLGTFPHGINIVQLADYFSLSNRSHAFTTLAPRIAAFGSYCPSMIDHLLAHKLGHWDAEIRELASRALSHLVVQLPSHGVRHVLPRLLPDCLSPTSDVRHGAILGVAEVALQLWGHHPHLLQALGSDAADPASLLEDVLQVVPKVEAERLYRGKGGDKVRIAVCRLIQCVAEARLPLPECSHYAPAVGAIRQTTQKARPVVKYLESLEGHLTHLQPQVQQAAVVAFGAFTQHYFPAWSTDLHEPLLRRLLEGLATSKTPNVRRGVALGLGALPNSILSHGEVFDDVSSALQRSLLVEVDTDVRDAEARANAVKGLCDVCCTVDAAYGLTDVAIRGRGIHGGNVCPLFNGLLAGLEDYCTDNRGDVGSFTRIASLEGCLRFLLRLGQSDARRPTPMSTPPLLTETLWLAFLKATLKQLMEKIDRLRAVAGSVLQRAVDSHHIPSHFPYKALLQDAIRRHESSQAVDFPDQGQSESSSSTAIDWSAPAITYPLLVPLLLPFRDFARPMLEGLVISVGGLSMHVVRAASASLVSTLKSLRDDGEVNLAIMSDILIQMFARHAQDDRVILPLLNTLDDLLTHQLLPAASQHRVLECIKAELAGSPKKDVNKLLAVVKVVCGLLITPLEQGADPQLRIASLLFLLALLGNRFPKVRTRTAQQLHSTLLTYTEHFSDIDEESMDKVLETLLDSAWDSSDATAVRTQRDTLYPLLGLSKPAPAPIVTPVPNLKPARPVDEGYASLVREMGY